MGEEDVTAYNARVEAAFEARRIIAWPFNGAVTIEEISKDKKLREIFVIDNWCLIESYKGDCNVGKKFQVSQKSSPHRFDYDSYKILYGYVMEEGNKVKVQKANK
jgi:DNA polymerase-3 subunit epsilon